MNNRRKYELARARRWLLGGLCAVQLWGRTAGADDWTGFGVTDNRGRLTSERSGALFERGWQHSLPPRDQAVYQHLLASPAVADGYVVFGGYDGVLRVVHALDGRRAWESYVRGPLHGSPAVERGRVFIPGMDGLLYVLRLDTGAEVYRKPLGGLGFGSPVIVEGSVLIATGEPTPQLVRLDAETGALLWATGEGHFMRAAQSSVAVAEGHVVVGDSSGLCHSFALGDGKWQWTADLKGTVSFSSPLVIGKRVLMVAGGETMKVHALELATGTPVPGWPLELPVPSDGEGAGTRGAREHVVSSAAGIAGLVVFNWRVDDRFDDNNDAVGDRFVSREFVVALDPEMGKARWMAPFGRREAKSATQIPMYGLCPTPALIHAAGEEVVIAASSSLDARVRVLGASNGADRWAAPLAGATRSSPSFANGQLVVATDAGTLHGFFAEANRPPVAPVFGFAPKTGQEVDVAGAKLAWGTAVDPEMKAIQYDVRLDDDGEILHDWDFRLVTAAGEVSLVGKLVAGHTYTYAVRARDPEGAFSSWSAPESFLAYGTPDITIGDRHFGSLDEALAAVQSGDVVQLAAGIYRLTKTLEVPAGVSVLGAGPHLTVLRGTGLPVAVKPGSGATLGQLTVASAHVGVQAAATDVHLRNVILRDNEQSGLEITAGGSADLVSATITRNGIGVRALGPCEVRNALVTANAVGLASAAPSFLRSHFNNVVDNRDGDYQGIVADPSDVGRAVAFEAGNPDELRLKPAQPSTDRGDPNDAFALEPLPNGGRINIGAFGNTPYAELSGAPLPEADAGVAADASGATGEGGGCGCRVGGGASSPPLAILGLGVLWAGRGLRRRLRSRD